MPTPTWLAQLRANLLAPRLTWNDRAMLALAAIDVVLLALRGDVPFVEDADQHRWINLFDWAVVGVFGVEFLVTIAATKRRKGFLRANWYDLVGLIPLHSPILRAFRFGRLIRIYVWGSRFPSEIEAKYGGEAYALTVLKRYEPVLVEELTDPLLVKLLGVLRRVAVEANYTSAMGERLETRRGDIHAVVVDAIKKSPALGLAYQVGPVKAGIDEVQKQAVDVLVAALTDPRLDDVIRDSIDHALARLQDRVAQKSWQREQGTAPT